jgi:hypothetical protein
VDYNQHLVVWKCSGDHIERRRQLQIKFSHRYPKLHGQKSAQLLSVKLCDRSELSEKFIEYDTVYEVEPAIGVCSESVIGHYPLPNGRYMVLLFQGDERIPFTTVRRYTDEKFRYYNSSLGKIFDIKYAAAV